MKLFEDEWGENDSPIDSTEITSILLYYDRGDAEIFKSLCKEGLKVEVKDYISDGNISDFILKILKEKYAHLLTKKTFDRAAGGSIEINFP